MAKTLVCPRCLGSGILPDPRVLGAEMREYRKRLNKSGTSVAAEMGITKGYLSDLELGKREWSTKLVKRFKEACHAAQAT